MTKKLLHSYFGCKPPDKINKQNTKQGKIKMKLKLSTHKTLLVAALIAAIFLTCAVSAAPVITVDTSAAPSPIPSGETVTVPVILTGNTGLGAFDIRIEPQTNADISVSETEPLDGVYTIGENNQISVSWYDVEERTEDKLTLFYIDVTPTQGTPVYLNLEIINIGQDNRNRWTDYTTVNGALSTDGSAVSPQEEHTIVQTPTPTPTATTTTATAVPTKTPLCIAGVIAGLIGAVAIANVRKNT